jgi:hypothetical protein
VLLHCWCGRHVSVCNRLWGSLGISSHSMSRIVLSRAACSAFCHAQHTARFVVCRSMQHVLLSCTACSILRILLSHTASSTQHTLLSNPERFTLQPAEDALNATQQWHFVKHCVAYMLESCPCCIICRHVLCVMLGGRLAIAYPQVRVGRT